MKIEHRNTADVRPYDRNPRLNDSAVDAVGNLEAVIASETTPMAEGGDPLYIAEPLRRLAVPISELNLDPANARQHDERNIEAIASSLKRWGQRQPIVVQRRGMIVRAGNGRVDAARKLGWTHLAAVVVDEDSVEATAYAIADNRTAELAEWDDAALADLLEALPDGLAGLAGFDEGDIDALLAGLAAGAEIVEDVAPEPPDDPVATRGDVWALGRHRLMCGDGGDEADVDRLLDGAPIHLANCDPPYGVAVQPRSNNAIAAGLSSFGPSNTKPSTHLQKSDLARHPEKGKATHKKLRAKDRPLVNDFVSDEEFERMLLAWFGQIARVLLPGRGFYIWGGYANWANYCGVLAEVGLYFSQGIAWVKDHPVLGRKDFMNDCEHCWYGWREGAAHKFLGPNNARNVWHVKKVNPQSMMHLTEKPVELAAMAIEYSSRPGENVLDLFGGSGSTLVAAEQTGRHAFLMEIDPAYCDVIVQRWENLTGQKAECEVNSAA